MRHARHRALWTLGMVAAALSAGVALAVADAPTTTNPTADATPAGREPPMEFEVTVGGEHVEVAVGQPARVTVDGKPVELTLQPKPTRRLVTGEVAFRYPTGHGFQFDPSGDTQQWTLDGNDTVIILDRHAKALDNAALVKQVADVVAAKFQGDVDRAPTTLKLGARTLEGTRLKINVGGSSIQQNIFAFDAGGVTYSFILQDSLRDDGGASEEMGAVSGLLSDTFEFAQ